MTPQEVLEKAAANIAEHGHCKGEYGSLQRGFCALGAIRYAATGTGVYRRDLNAAKTHDLVNQAELMLVLELAKDGWRCGESLSLVPMFNDAEATSAEDVMLMMKRAAHA